MLRSWIERRNDLNDIAFIGAHEPIRGIRLTNRLVECWEIRIDFENDFA